MADDRTGPSIDRVREQMRRGAAPEPHEHGTGPDPEHVEDERDRVEAPPKPSGDEH